MSTLTLTSSREDQILVVVFRRRYKVACAPGARAADNLGAARSTLLPCVCNVGYTTRHMGGAGAG